MLSCKFIYIRIGIPSWIASLELGFEYEFKLEFQVELLTIQESVSRSGKNLIAGEQETEKLVPLQKFDFIDFVMFLKLKKIGLGTLVGAANSSR